MNNPNLPKLKIIPLKERISVISIEHSQIDLVDGVVVSVDAAGNHTQIPMGGIACIMLEPGTRISHRAVQAAATVGTLILWIGEGGVRVYSAGMPGTSRVDHLLYQARLALDDELRLKVVRKMYSERFKEPAPMRRSIEQLRGIEGARVKRMYQIMAQKYGLEWRGRNYDHKNWTAGDIANQCISAATSCLYGITEAAILISGYSPAIGFIHSGNSQSFVYDIADVIKFDHIIPMAFKIAKSIPDRPDRSVRLACRDFFRTDNTLAKLIPLIEDILSAGEIDKPKPFDDQILSPFDEK